MPETKYAAFGALNPLFEVIQKGLTGLVDGEHYFDTIADDAFFDFRYRLPGWPPTIRGRANLMAQFSGYGDNIRLHSADGLVVHQAQDRRVVILEYEVHGKILSTDAPYDNRLISVVTITNTKIVHWRATWLLPGNCSGECPVQFASQQSKCNGWMLRLLPMLAVTRLPRHDPVKVTYGSPSDSCGRSRYVPCLYGHCVSARGITRSTTTRARVH